MHMFRKRFAVCITSKSPSTVDSLAIGVLSWTEFAADYLESAFDEHPPSSHEITQDKSEQMDVDTTEDGAMSDRCDGAKEGEILSGSAVSSVDIAEEVEAEPTKNVDTGMMEADATKEMGFEAAADATEEVEVEAAPEPSNKVEVEAAVEASNEVEIEAATEACVEVTPPVQVEATMDAMLVEIQAPTEVDSENAMVVETSAGAESSPMSVDFMDTSSPPQGGPTESTLDEDLVVVAGVVEASLPVQESAEPSSESVGPSAPQALVEVDEVTEIASSAQDVTTIQPSVQQDAAEVTGSPLTSCESRFTTADAEEMLDQWLDMLDSSSKVNDQSTEEQTMIVASTSTIEQTVFEISHVVHLETAQEEQLFVSPKNITTTTQNRYSSGSQQI